MHLKLILRFAKIKFYKRLMLGGDKDGEGAVGFDTSKAVRDLLWLRFWINLGVYPWMLQFEKYSAIGTIMLY